MNETYPGDFEDIIFGERNVGESGDVIRISMRDIQGRDMYCSDEAREEITERLSKIPDAAHMIHFIDTGNYHYLSGIFTSFINEKYDLVLIDHHTDMQETAFGEILSCGSWAGEVLKRDKNLRSLIVCGPENAEGGKKFYMNIPGKEVPCHVFGDSNQDMNIPLYISVDKDVLSRDECVTNWDQGDLTLEDLTGLINNFTLGRKMIGADICGGISSSDPDFGNKASEKNTATDLSLHHLLMEREVPRRVVCCQKSLKII